MHIEVNRPIKFYPLEVLPNLGKESSSSNPSLALSLNTIAQNLSIIIIISHRTKILQMYSCIFECITLGLDFIKIAYC